MSSTKEATGDKPTATSDETGPKTDRPRAPSTGGHEETGAERFASLGGSGGVPQRTGQGYESLAQH